LYNVNGTVKIKFIKMSKSSFIIVIRSAEERTLTLCQKIANTQSPQKPALVVREIPFELALRRCYEMGMKSGCKWMVTLDADVLLVPNAIEPLLDEAEQMPDHFIQIEGRVYDKVFGEYRPAGHRIYRTSMLSTALDCLPLPGTQSAPEYFTLSELGKRGHPSRYSNLVVGIHDFEQNYSDLYRKAFIQGQKFSQRAAEIIRRLGRLKNSDPDFLVLFKGYIDGLTAEDSARVDKNHYLEASAAALVECGLVEKEPLSDDFAASEFIQAALQATGPSPQMQPYDAHENMRQNGWLKRISNSVRKNGVPWTLRNSAAAAFMRAGRTLHKS
jgi:hypothetical protein